MEFDASFAPSTTGQHLATAAEFLSAALPRRRDLQALSAEAVERFVVTSGHRVTRQTLQHTVATLGAIDWHDAQSGAFSLFALP